MIAVPLVERASSNLLLRAAGANMILLLLTAGYVASVRPNTLAFTYFFDQDLWLLLASIMELAFLGLFLGDGAALRQITPWQATAFIVSAALVAQMGCSLVMERFGASGDEAMAEFAAAYLQRGMLGAPIPSGLRELRSAMMPFYTEIRGNGSWWVASYYPVNAAFRAMAGWVFGDRWLAGPLLLAIGLAGLWRAARTLWPERSRAPTVALLLGLSSAQLLANAMTPYAMTAQFAIEAWWIAAIVRGTRNGYWAAALLGLLGTGVHQAHFHPQFALGILAWLWGSGRRRAAVLQVIAIGIAWLFWDRLYLHGLLDPVLGVSMTGSSAVDRLGFVQRLLEVDPLPSLARFVAWQNILLAPLALIGARAAMRSDPRPATWGMAISCALGLLITVDSVHTFGARYLSGLLPCFCLLATDGWFHLEEREGRPLGGKLLWTSVAMAWLVTGPFALWRSHAMIHPYAEAYRMTRGEATDIVFVDPRHVAFAQDIIRFDDPAGRPLILDLPKVPMAALTALCRRRVMIFDWRQAHALGMASWTTQLDADAAAPRRAWLSRHSCGTGVPIVSGS